jgi:hypothetical protein
VLLKYFVFGLAGAEDMLLIRQVTCFWRLLIFSSNFSILSVNSPVLPICSATVASSPTILSKSLSCSFKTFTIKSSASSASSLDCGGLAILPVLFMYRTTHYTAKLFIANEF